MGALQPNIKNSIGILLLMVVVAAICTISIQFSDKNRKIDTRTAEASDETAAVANGSYIDSSSCETRGGMADENGLKVWCWNTIGIPEYTGRAGIKFAQGQLKIASECNEKQVSIVKDRLSFSVDPIAPPPGDWCRNKYNMRAEITTVPWKIKHEKGTEEWFGWDYTLGENYRVDKEAPWSFFQVHPGVTGIPPHTSLMIVSKGQMKGHNAGEVFVANSATDSNKYKATGFLPRPGETFNIVVHAIWGDASNGLLQVWINGVSVYDQQVATVYSDYPWGGNAKWGIYKWRWRDESYVQKSIEQGITKLQTSMGSLRILTRTPDHPEYGKDAYFSVEPQ